MADPFIAGAFDARAGLEIFFIVILGLLYGSFTTALIWRIPRGVSWVFTKNRGAARSACTHCGMVLGLFDLVPVFSWILMRGRCRHCGMSIGWVYPVVELSTVVLCLGVYTLWGLNAPGMVVMAAVPFLIALFVIDLRYFILPDQINVVLGILGLGYQLLTGGWTAAGVALLLGAAWGAGAFALGYLMKKILKKDALGLGDVKFFIVAGIWVPVLLIPAFLMWAGVCGVVMGLIWKITGRGAVFPFGPALILSFVLCLVLGRADISLLSGGLAFLTAPY